MGERTAVLAGGCFWGMEELMRSLPGVLDTEVGYTGGDVDNPKYGQVKTGSTGHAEALQIRYDSSLVSFRQLLKVFFQIHDPTTKHRQGNDIGSQYRSAIFYNDEDERQQALALIAEIDASGKWPGPVETEVVPFTKFWPAEHYHQDYLQTYPDGYTCHRVRRDWVLDAISSED